MTWTAVQQGAIASGTTTVAPAITASTAGNLLVATVFNDGADPFTAPANWVLATRRAVGTVAQAELWYYLANPGGITTATFTATSGDGCSGEIAEFHSTAAAVILDQKGNGGGTGLQTSFTVAESAASLAGDLGIVAFSSFYSSAPGGETWTTPVAGGRRSRPRPRVRGPRVRGLLPDRPVRRDGLSDRHSGHQH